MKHFQWNFIFAPGGLERRYFVCVVGDPGVTLGTGMAPSSHSWQGGGSENFFLAMWDLHCNHFFFQTLTPTPFLKPEGKSGPHHPCSPLTLPFSFWSACWLKFYIPANVPFFLLTVWKKTKFGPHIHVEIATAVGCTWGWACFIMEHIWNPDAHMHNPSLVLVWLWWKKGCVWWLLR